MAISVAAVGDKMVLGQALTVATAPAANRLDELVRARRRRQDHGNPGCLRETLIQFGPTCSLLVWKENYFGLARCIDRRYASLNLKLILLYKTLSISELK